MERGWKYRRIAVFVTVAFCMLVIGWSTLFAEDTAIARDIVSSAFLLLAATVNGYVFGAIADDRIKGKEQIAMAGMMSPPPPPPGVL